MSIRDLGRIWTLWYCFWRTSPIWEETSEPEAVFLSQHDHKQAFNLISKHNLRRTLRREVNSNSSYYKWGNWNSLKLFGTGFKAKMGRLWKASGNQLQWIIWEEKSTYYHLKMVRIYALSIVFLNICSRTALSPPLPECSDWGRRDKWCLDHMNRVSLVYSLRKMASLNPVAKVGQSS